MRQLTVANENAQSTGIKKLRMDGSNRVRNGCESKCIVRPSPSLPRERQPRRNRAINVSI
jgi:hypothetical protein